MLTPAYSATATERVLPRMALDFTTASLDPRVTVTRALNTATRVNSSGLIASINADLPRFDYNPATLACKGLLIEETRTNLALYSQQFDDASWTKVESSISANAANGPDGTLSADKFIPSTNNVSNHLIRTNLTAPVGNNAWSVFIAPAGYAWVRLMGVKGDGTTYSAYFNVTTGTVGTVAANTTATIEGPFANGFYRCTVASTTSSASAAAQNQFIYAASADNTATFAGDGTSGYYLWGAQLEAGAFPTSYIPTTTISVTRNADVVTMTGTNFSSWWNSTAGTFFTSYQTLVNSSISAARGILTYDSSGNKLVTYIGGGGTTASTYDGSSIVAATGSAVATASKTVMAYSSTGRAIATNGGTVATGSAPSAGFLTATLLNIGALNVSTTGQINGYIKAVRYWPQRLTNAEIQAFSK